MTENTSSSCIEAAVASHFNVGHHQCMVLAILGEETQTLGMSATENDRNAKEMEETTCLSHVSMQLSLLLLENMPADKPLMMDFLQK